MAEESIMRLEKSRRSPLARLTNRLGTCGPCCKGVFPIAKRTFWFSEIQLFLVLSGLCCMGTGAAQIPLVITSPLALPNGSVGIPYSVTVTASGGNPHLGYGENHIVIITAKGGVVVLHKMGVGINQSKHQSR